MKKQLSREYTSVDPRTGEEYDPKAGQLQWVETDQDQPEPVITKAMIDAGTNVYESLVEIYPGYLLVQEIYKAMWAASQPPANLQPERSGRMDKL